MKPYIKNLKVIDSGLTLVQNEKTVILFNKPIYVGAAVLDLSKLLMYDFYYNVLKKKVNPELIYMDTDSFIVELDSDNPHKELAEYMDLSNLGEYYPYCPTEKIENKDKNKGVLGKFKDESAGQVISKVIALRSKMYSVKYYTGEEIKRIKGISRTTVKKNVNFEDYENTLDNKTIQRHKMKTIRSINHDVQLLTINKVSLSPFDDKRYILDDGVITLPFGHSAIN